jgi:hypothetical protein
MLSELLQKLEIETAKRNVQVMVDEAVSCEI